MFLYKIGNGVKIFVIILLEKLISFINVILGQLHPEMSVKFDIFNDFSLFTTAMSNRAPDIDIS